MGWLSESERLGLFQFLYAHRSAGGKPEDSSPPGTGKTYV